MKNADESFREPEALNASELMWEIVAATPAMMRDINGVVNVDMRICVDEAGRVESVDVVRCTTISGLPVRPDEPEIVEAAQKAIRVLRFRPAMREGVPVRRDGLELSFGFTTTALETGLSHLRRSVPFN